MKNTPFEYAPVRLPPKIQRQRVDRVIREELTQNQREILIAYYFQGMNIPAIARQRGVCKSTVSRTLHRAEERLRRCLRY